MSAWEKFAPFGRFSLTMSTASLRPSAVAVLLINNGGQIKTLYLQRTARPTDRHSGQISFPGGKQDPEDYDLIETALRELQEETQIQLDRTAFIGALSPLPVPISKFIVHPYVFYTESLPEIILSPEEAEAAYEVPLDALLDPSNYKFTKVHTTAGHVLTNTPYFDVIHGQILWGATAMITSELVDIWKRLIGVD